MTITSERDGSLDAMRGIAALSVFGWHAMLAFYPESSGYFGDAPIELTARSQFWFVAFNGPGAVAFFFVLSGFVLARASLITGRTDNLTRGLLKRWPRLAGPALVAVLSSWALFALGFYFYQPAALVTHSPWLAEFGGAAGGPTDHCFSAAVLQGAVFTFLRGDSSYDSSLWTMAYEFYGSLMVYALGFLLAPRPNAALRGAVIAMAGLACAAVNPALTPFVVGFALAAFLPSGRLRAAPGLAAVTVALALLVCGYTDGARGFYAPFAMVLPPWLPLPALYAAAAAALIAAVESWPGLQRGLSSRWGRICGELSFPFYLIHLPVLCSAGAFALLATGSRATAIGATLAIAIGAAFLLALVNRWWLATLNLAVAALLTRRPAAAAVSPS